MERRARFARLRRIVCIDASLFEPWGSLIYEVIKSIINKQIINIYSTYDYIASGSYIIICRVCGAFVLHFYDLKFGFIRFQ